MAQAIEVGAGKTKGQRGRRPVRASPTDVAYLQAMEQANKCIADGAFRRALHLLSSCVASPTRDFLMAKALVTQGVSDQLPSEEWATRARRLLEPMLFDHDSPTLRLTLREEIVSLLIKTVESLDPSVAALLSTGQLRPGTSRALDVLTAFYYGDAAHGPTPAERAFSAKAELLKNLPSGRSFSPHDTYIQFLKSYSSFSPLLTAHDSESLGGGYFLALSGLGIVVDPGHHFLDNFFQYGRSIDDVDCIFVTHFHDDHFADLPALLSLLYQRYKKGARRRTLFFADDQTRKMFQPIVEASHKYVIQRTALRGDDPTWHRLSTKVSFLALPAKHPVWSIKEGAAVGIAFRIERCPPSYLLITGDTGWSPVQEKIYGAFHDKSVTLVAHLSSVAREEAVLPDDRHVPGFYPSHLCVHGVCKLIEAAHPKTIILSEIGEELKSVVWALARTIEQVYSIECRVCVMGLQQFL